MLAGTCLGWRQVTDTLVRGDGGSPLSGDTMKDVNIRLKLDLDAGFDNDNLGNELYLMLQEMYGIDMRTADIEVDDE